MVEGLNYLRLTEELSETPVSELVLPVDKPRSQEDSTILEVSNSLIRWVQWREQNLGMVSQDEDQADQPVVDSETGCGDLARSTANNLWILNRFAVIETTAEWVAVAPPKLQRKYPPLAVS